MSSLSSLVEASSERQRSNLSRLETLRRRNDVVDWSPSAEASPSSSMQIRTDPSDEPTSTTPPDYLRDLIPARHNGNGGPYGRAILERVARNYGLE